MISETVTESRRRAPSPCGYCGRSYMLPRPRACCSRGREWDIKIIAAQKGTPVNDKDHVTSTDVVSEFCADGEHQWCANRTPQESHCKCSCHARKSATVQAGNAFVAKYGREPKSASDAAWLNGYAEALPTPNQTTDVRILQSTDRIIRAAIAFVGAIETDTQIATVSKQALDEWIELSDAVIDGRRTAGAFPAGGRRLVDELDPRSPETTEQHPLLGKRVQYLTHWVGTMHAVADGKHNKVAWVRRESDGLFETAHIDAFHAFEGTVTT